MAVINPEWVTKEVGSFQTAEEMNTLATAVKNNAVELQTDITNLSTHVNNKSNPHEVTKAQLNLENVDNISDANKPVSIAQAEAIAVVQTDIDNHEANLSNPHEVTKAQVGLSEVDNTSDLNKPISIAQQTAINAASTTFNNHVNDTDNPHNVTKIQLGLSNVDNTSDLAKPISTATQNALDTKEDISNKGIAGGYAGLDANGKVPENQLPSSTNDVLEYISFSYFPSIGESGKIYIAKDTNKLYRWEDSTYIYIKSGAVDSVAGKVGIVTLDKNDVGLPNVDNTSDMDKPISNAQNIAFNDLRDDINGHEARTDNPHSVTKAQIGLSAVDNTSDADKPISSATQTALNLKENTSNKGAVNGYASLDETGKVPTGQLPSYVDDVLEYANLASFPVSGEQGKIYVALDTNKTYRWSGSAYIYITSGSVDSVAGKIGVVSLVKGDVGLGNVDNTSDADKPVSTVQQTSLNLKADKARQVIAGSGLTGGGTLEADRTINVTATDDSIIVAADGIKVDTQNLLTSTSVTKPLAANQGKVLDEKITQVGANITQNTANVKRVKNSGKEFFSINGKYYRADNGTFTVSSLITCTDKIPINGDINTFCYMGGTSYPNYGISFFDESKQFISGLSSIDGIYGEKDYYITSSLFPANAKYFSLSNFTDSLSNAFLISGLQGNLLGRVNVIEESIYPIPTMETDISDLQKSLSYSDAIAGAVITTNIGDQAFKNAVSAIWINMIVPDAVLPEKLYLVYFENRAGMYNTVLTFYDSIGGNAIFSYSANDGPKTGVQNLVIPATSGGGLMAKANLQVVIDWDIISGKSYSPNSTEFITSEMNRSQTSTMDLKEKFVEIDEKISILNQITLQGKTIVSFGDSLTEMVDTTNSKHYTDYISEKTGATVINLGIGGTHLRQRTTPTPLFSDVVPYNINDRVLYEDAGTMKWYKFTSPHLGSWSGTDVELLTSNSLIYANVDIINLIKASCNKQFSDVIAAAKYIAATQSDDNIAIINRLIAIDWSKVDGVTMFGGTNDWYNANTIGVTGSNDVNYTLGAINEMIRLILTTYPHLKIYWFTPIVRWLDYNGTNGFGTDAQWSDVYSVTGNGTLKEFSAKIQNEVSLNHIPVCDMYNTLGWNKYNFKNYFQGNDGTHPRAYNGVTYLAKKMLQFILSNNTL